MLWAVIICGGIYGIVMLMNGEGAGGQITKIACTCGMMIVIAGQLKLIDVKGFEEYSGYAQIEQSVKEGSQIHNDQVASEVVAALKEKVLDIGNTRGLECFVYVDLKSGFEILGVELYHPENPNWTLGDKLRDKISSELNIPNERIRKYEK